MKLEVGQHAPDFSIEAIDGTVVSLKSYEYKKLLICFYRYAGCPMCNFYLSLLIAHYKHFQDMGLNVIAVFQSPKQAVIDYPGKQNPPFPLVADPDKKLYSLFGVEASFGKFLQPKTAGAFFNATVKGGFPQKTVDGDFFLMPAQFLIGPPSFTIYKAHYWNNLADPLPTEVIEQFLHTSPTFVVTPKS